MQKYILQIFVEESEVHIYNVVICRRQLGDGLLIETWALIRQGSELLSSLKINILKY